MSSNGRLYYPFYQRVHFEQFQTREWMNHTGSITLNHMCGLQTFGAIVNVVEPGADATLERLTKRS